MSTIIELAPFQAKRVATENLLDLADLALASNGMGLSCGMKIKCHPN